MFRVWILPIVFLLSYTTTTMAQRPSPKKAVPFEWCFESQERHHCKIENYNDLYLSKILSKQDLQAGLQSLVNASYQVGFRYLGHFYDLFHGHLIYTKDFKPIANLYHTQEDALRFSQEDPDSKFGYLDKDTRNWLQFFDDQFTSVNAQSYASENSKTDPAFKVFRSAFTITTEMLDLSKIMNPTEEIRTKQWSFYRIPCSFNTDPNSNVLEIKMDRFLEPPICVVLD